MRAAAESFARRLPPAPGPHLGFGQPTRLRVGPRRSCPAARRAPPRRSRTGRRAGPAAQSAFPAAAGADTLLQQREATADPAAGIELPPAPPPERTTGERILDRVGKQRLIEACAKGQRARHPGGGVREETIVRAAVEGGLRRGEIAALKWPDVRFDELRLIVRRAIHHDETIGKVEKLPKGNRVQRVAISDEFAERLALWYRVSVLEGGNSATGFVWPGRDRVSPLHPTTLSHLIGRLGRAAGLTGPLGRHIAHLHGLRHTAGSMALANGVSLPVVQARLRHSRADFTASAARPPRRRAGQSAGGTLVS